MKPDLEIQLMRLKKLTGSYSAKSSYFLYINRNILLAHQIGKEQSGNRGQFLNFLAGYGCIGC